MRFLTPTPPFPSIMNTGRPTSNATDDHETDSAADGPEPTANGASDETDATAESNADGGVVYQADAERPPSQAIVRAVAAASDVDDVTAVAEEFGPLYTAIDPSALDALFESTSTAERSEGCVSFAYAGYCVTVDTTGRVELVPRE